MAKHQPAQHEFGECFMTDPVSPSYGTDVEDQLQSPDATDDDARVNEPWTADIGQQLNADIADVIEQRYPVSDYDDDDGWS